VLWPDGDGMLWPDGPAVEAEGSAAEQRGRRGIKDVRGRRRREDWFQRGGGFTRARKGNRRRRPQRAAQVARMGELGKGVAVARKERNGEPRAAKELAHSRAHDGHGRSSKPQRGPKERGRAHSRGRPASAGRGETGESGSGAHG